MKHNKISGFCCAGVVIVLIAALVGCKSNQATPTAVSKSLSEINTSQALDTSYAGALDAYHQLMLGTVRLEGTSNAVTPEQAKTLLIVWQALQGRALQSDAEREAVLAYIETQMTSAQLKAIAAMQLTQNDLQSPIPDNNPGSSRGGAVAGTRSAPAGGAMPPQMSTRQAQSGRGTPQAGNATRGATTTMGTGSAQDAALLNALIRLLSQRSAEGSAPSGSGSGTRTPASRPLPASTPTP